MKLILNGRKFATVTGSIEFTDVTSLYKASTTMGETSIEVSTHDAKVDGGVLFAEKELIRHGHKISAIKSYRDRTGYGLKEAKDVIYAQHTRMLDAGEYFYNR